MVLTYIVALSKTKAANVVRDKRIELLSPAWKAGILPLNQSRNRHILL